MVTINYEGADYDIQLTRRGLVEVEKKYDYSFMKTDMDSLTDIMTYIAMLILAGTRKTHKDMKLDTAMDVADAFIEEKGGFEEALKELSEELEVVLNPKKGGKKNK